MAAVLAPTPAAAVTVTVACDADALRTAVGDIANDVINLTAGCAYNYATAVGDNAFAVVSRALTINGNGATIARTGGVFFRLFEVTTADGDLTLNNLTLTGGRAPNGAVGAHGLDGGAVRAADESKLRLTGVTLTGNRAGDGGGGLAPTHGGSGGAVWSSGELTMNNVTVTGNGAGDAGEIGAAGQGAGVAMWAGLLTGRQVTIAYNDRGKDGGGTEGSSAQLAGSVEDGSTLTNSIVASVIAGPGDDPACIISDGAFSDVAGSLATDNTCGIAGPFANPALGALANNGGLTRTMAIGPGSPALNLGAANCLATDQRGIARSTPCDAGAFEYVAPPPPPPPDPDSDPDPEPPVITDVTPKRLPRGKTTRVAVTGLRFQTGATFTLTGTGITWTLISLSPPTSAVLDISVAENGQPPRGGVTVRITNPDGGTDEWCCLELYSPEPPRFTRTFDPEDPERIGTAIAVSKLSHPTGSETAALVASERYPDALAAGPLAALLDAPVLLTDSTGLPAAVADELTRLQVRTVILVGGYAALDERVADDLRALGITVERLRGVDRYGTARAVAERIGGDEAYITVGGHADSNLGWPDAVATSGLASMRRVPIVLVHSDGIPADSAAALSGRRSATIVGGEAVVSEDVEEALIDSGLDVDRLSGDNRYATSVATARSALARGARPSNVWLVTGHAFTDGLAASGAVAKARGLLLFVDGTDPAGGPETLALLSELAGRIRRVSIVGGTGAVTPAVESAIRDAVGAG